jgi:hypothetical protein
MNESSKLNRVALISALVLSLSAIVLATAATTSPAKPAEDLLRLIPADTMFCVRINNLNAALGQMDLFLTGLSPVLVSMPAKAQLGLFLGSPGNPEPNGVDMAGSFVLFGPLPDANATGLGGIGILVPVTDYRKFATGNPNIKPANAQGISKITDQQEGMTGSVIQIGSYALIGETSNDATLLAMKQAMMVATTRLASNLDAAELKRATNAPVWAYLNVKVVAKKYGAMLTGLIEMAKGMMGAVPGQTPAMADQARAQMDMSGAMLDALLNQSQFITLSLDPNANVFLATAVIAALPDTQMADTFKGSPTRIDAKMLGYLKDGAAMNFVTSFDTTKWTKLNAMYLDMFIKFMGKGLLPDDVAAIKKLTTESGEALGGAIAGSLAANPQSKPPFEVQYVATVKDPAKFNQVLDGVVKMMNPGGALASLYKSMGTKTTVDLKRKIATYKGVDIDSMKFSVAMTDANSPASKTMAAMYGSGMNLQLAMTNGLLLYSLAGDPNTAIHGLIDQVKAGGPTRIAGEVQAALQSIPGADRGSFFATFNALRLMQMMAAISPVPMPMGQTPMPTQSNLVLVGTCGDGKASLEMAVPKQHAMEIMGAVMQMQMQMMMQQQQNQPQTQPKAQPQQGNHPSTL